MASKVSAQNSGYTLSRATFQYNLQLRFKHAKGNFHSSGMTEMEGKCVL